MDSLLKKSFIKKIGKKSVKFILLGKDRYKRYLAKCLKGNINLNKWMVRNGYAVAYRRYSKELYIFDEDLCKRRKIRFVERDFYQTRKMEKVLINFLYNLTKVIHFKKNCIFGNFFDIIFLCSSIPKNTQNSCAIFEERYLWYKYSKATYEKWGVPIYIQLSIC